MSVVIFALHLLAFAVALSALALERFLLGRALAGPVGELRVRQLARIDAVYGMAALTSLVTGLDRVFVHGKGSTFYLGNPVFWTKMSVFALIGLLSVWPTVQYLRHHELTLTDWARNRADVVRRLRRLTLIQIVLYLLLPFLAVALAQGIQF